MRWLEEIETLFSTEFSDTNWVNQLITDETLDTFIKNLKDKEEKIFIKVFENLNFSVIEGEFVSDCERFKLLIKSIFDKVGNVQASLITDPRDADYQFSNALKEQKFLFSVKKAVSYYERVADSINKQMANPHKTIVLDFSNALDGTRRYFEKKDDVLEQSLFELFSENLLLCWRGFFLNNDNSEFRDIIATKTSLEGLKKDIVVPKTNFLGIIDLLYEICIFYQRKLIIRIQQDETRFNEKYIFNQTEYDFSLNEHHHLKTTYFNIWDEYCQHHFLSETNSERQVYLRRRVEELLRKNKWKATNFFELHSTIKYYKDLNPNLQNLENLITFFDEYEAKTEYNKFAFSVSKNYLKNNILSFKISNSDLNEIDELIDEYKLLQSDSSINNFFPFYKLCIFLKDYIKKKTATTNIENSIFSKNLVDAKKALEKLKICYDHYKISFDWSKQHLFFAYQMPFEECRRTIKIGNGDDEIELNLFLTSTFSLKVDYKKYEAFSKEVENFILNSENEIRILNNVQNLNNRLDIKEKEITEELKDQSKKNIELLSVFTAILALIFGGISTAAGKASFEEKFLTFISLFIVLFSFITLIRTFINKEKSLFEIIGLFFLYIVSLILIICILSITVKFNI